MAESYLNGISVGVEFFHEPASSVKKTILRVTVIFTKRSFLIVMFFFPSKSLTQTREVCFIYVSYIIRCMLDNYNSFESLYNSYST